ncbi:hypothetical protein D3C84_1096640 [compost metagenome]
MEKPNEVLGSVTVVTEKPGIGSGAGVEVPAKPSGAPPAASYRAFSALVLLLVSVTGPLWSGFPMNIRYVLVQRLLVVIGDLKWE